MANQDAKGLVAQIQFVWRLFAEQLVPFLTLTCSLNRKLSLAIKSKQLEDRFHETTDPKELAFALPRDDQGPPSFPVNLAMPWGTETWVTRLADYSSDLFCCRYSVADSWDDQKSPPQSVCSSPSSPKLVVDSRRLS